MNAVDRERVGALGLAFAIPFALYLATLAPTVTLEDSGELIAAAATLGVPHSPGYPLFTMLGHAFSRIPIGNLAYRLNLMSAFFSSVAALLLAWATALAIERLTGREREAPSSALVLLPALAAALWFATSYETWEQSVITEVYALNAAVFAAFLVLLFSGARLAPRCFVLGLALTAHPVSLVLIPLLALTLWIERPPVPRPREWLRAAAAFVLGLAPYAYLPLASLRDPSLDWGDPETPAKLLRAVVVRPLRLGDGSGPGELAERVRAYAGLLADQWAPASLALALVGLWATHRWRRGLFWQCAALLVLTGPVVTLLTNIPVSAPDPRITAENLAQVSVHYVPSYAVIALLMGVGVHSAARFAASRVAVRRAILAGALLLPLALAPGTCRQVDMRDDRLAEDYAENLFAVASPGAVVLADWDPFHFPLVYYQVAEGRRPDLTLLDRHLLRHGWYVEQWRQRHPDTSALVRAEIDAFLEGVRPFEAGRPHDGREIERRYQALLRALVARTVEAGRDVYLTFDPPDDLTVGLFVESVLVARRPVRRPVEPAAIDESRLRFRGLLEGPPVRDRFGRVFGDYYGELAYERGALVESEGDSERALDLYRRAERLLGAGHARRPGVRRQIERLERQLGSAAVSPPPAPGS